MSKPILQIWDEESQKYVSIPAIKGPKGDSGKSAYQYAQEGGYPMTETDFCVDLADVSTKQSKITAKGILMGDGSGGVSAARKGFDYAEGSHGIEVTLTAAAWSDGVQTKTIMISGFAPISASTNGFVRISQSATDEQFVAWCAALPRVTEQGPNTITIKAAGTVPTIDIPVEVLIV